MVGEEEGGDIGGRGGDGGGEGRYVCLCKGFLPRH